MTADKRREKISAEHRLQLHEEELRHRQEVGDRMGVVIARLNITSLRMQIAQLDRELAENGEEQ